MKGGWAVAGLALSISLDELAVGFSLRDRNIHYLSLARLLGYTKREESADYSLLRRQRIAQADAHSNGRPVGESRYVAQPTHRLADVAIASFLPIRTGLPIARDAHQHDTWISLAHPSVAQVPGFQPTRAEVLDHDVAPGD